MIVGVFGRITAAGVATEAILEPGFGTESADAAAAPKNKKEEKKKVKLRNQTCHLILLLLN